jgi:16S rRNA (cytosine1402-N4)-methyltransferase
LLEASTPDGRVLAFDRDPEAIINAKRQLLDFGERVTYVQGSFAKMAEIGPVYGFEGVDGILLDLGLSSVQLADANRGFSFMHDGPLDMRFDPSIELNASDLVNQLPAEELAEIFRLYGEVRGSERLAKAIVSQRPVHSTRELADLLVRETAFLRSRRRRGKHHARGRGRTSKVHPATMVFQALRIAVNDELGELEEGLEAAVKLLNIGGRLAVISFHSLEDRIVKLFIRQKSLDCHCPPEQPICTCDVQASLRAVTRKVVRPTEEEVTSNPRSRSAKLRVAEKLAGE